MKLMRVRLMMTSPSSDHRTNFVSHIFSGNSENYEPICVSQKNLVKPSKPWAKKHWWKLEHCEPRKNQDTSPLRPWLFKYLASVPQSYLERYYFQPCCAWDFFLEASRKSLPDHFPAVYRELFGCSENQVVLTRTTWFGCRTHFHCQWKIHLPLPNYLRWKFLQGIHTVNCNGKSSPRRITILHTQFYWEGLNDRNLH